MSVLDRASLEQSPLADLHALASELSLDGYRRLRKPELIDAILARQGEDAPDGGGAEGGDEVPEDVAGAEQEEQPAARRRRGRRGGRGRGGQPRDVDEAVPDAQEDADAADFDQTEPELGEQLIEGVIELLPNGSGFVRLNPPDPSDEDVYISSAQVKRCELVAGDRVAGPRRPPRRSERFASLSRIDTINGRPASEVAGGIRFEELPAAFPSERFVFASDDPTISAIESLAPIGRGSRVTIVGAPQAGKTSALRKLAQQLARDETLALWLVLVGVRPEEVFEWQGESLHPAASLPLGASADAQGQAVEGVIEQAKRMAARGTHAAVLIDTLDWLPQHAAARALGAARNLRDGGSLTVIATASQPHGGETTVIALDGSLARTGMVPAIDHAASWTMRVDALVGEIGAEAIARARAETPGE